MEPTRRVTVKALATLASDESGASFVEYALIVTLVAVACIVALTVIGKTVASMFSKTATSF